MQCNRIFEIIDSLEKKYIDIWEDVCNIESPTFFKEGIDKVGEYFINLAKKLGFDIEVSEQEKAGNAICITMNPTAEAQSVCFSGHIDTVHPLGLFGTPAVRKDDDNIYGPGVTDCKGGVVASFMALEALELCGFKSRPVKLIIQTDEETSSENSNKKTIEFMCEKAKNAVAFLNTEPAKGYSAVLVRKGIVRYKFNVHGIAVHSAVCYQGANAVAEAAHKILELEKLKSHDGITCNCGVINGGTVANTVAAECCFFADIRFNNKEEFDKANEIVCGVADNNTIDGCSCDVEQISFRPAMPLTEVNTQFLNKINDVYESNSLPILERRATVSGSDAAYITEIGVPCVDSIGVEGKNIHSINEFARLNSLKESAKRLAAVAFCI